MNVGSWKQRLPNVTYTNETLYIPIIILLNAPYMYICIFFFLGGGEGNFGEGSILFMLLILAFYPTNLAWGSNTPGISRETEPPWILE